MSYRYDAVFSIFYSAVSKWLHIILPDTIVDEDEYYISLMVEHEAFLDVVSSQYYHLGVDLIQGKGNFVRYILLKKFLKEKNNKFIFLFKNKLTNIFLL